MRNENKQVGQIRAEENPFAGVTYTLCGDQLHCGDTLMVLIVNGLTMKTEWVETRFEMASDGQGILIGLLGYDPHGLFAYRL